MTKPTYQLPLLLPCSAQIRTFTQVPVVVGAYISKTTGHPLDIAAKLYVRGTPAPAAAAEAAEGEVAAALAAPSMQAVEAMMED